MGRTNNQNLASLQQRIVKKKRKEKGAGAKKYGRNEAKCKHYRTARSYKNKLLKLRRHLKIHLNDGCAIQALEVAKRTL